MIPNFEFLFFFQVDRIKNDRSNRKRREEIVKALFTSVTTLFFSVEFPSKEFYDIEFWISFFFFWFDRIENTEAIGKGEKKLPRLLYYSLFFHRVSIERILGYQVLNFFFSFRLDRGIENGWSNNRKRREEIVRKKKI